MDISGHFSASFQALRSRFGLFLLLVIWPALLSIAVLLVTAAIIGGAAAANPRNPNGGLIVLGIVVFVVGIVLTWLAALKAYGMMSLAAYEIAQGQHPDFKGLFARSKGYLPRFVALILLAIVAAIVVQVLLFAIFGGLIAAAANGDNRGLGGAAALGMVLLFLLGIPLSIFLSVKLLYIVPAIAIEQYSGFDALKRSWNLTKGEFWRTFGYAILPVLAVSAISYAISLLSSAVLAPLANQQSNSGQPSALLIAALPVLIIGFILQIVVQLFTTPFLQSYNTYMYIDQIRRKELVGQQAGFAAPGGYGYPGAQQYPPQGQQYPPQGQQYPPQGQQYPPQGQQYPPQGQQQPPQGQQYPPQGQQQPPGQAGPGQQDGPPQPGQSQNQWPGQN